MNRVAGVFVGVVVGWLVWVILSIILIDLGLSRSSIGITIFGWLFAALMGGYVSERMGGRGAVALLVVLGPVVAWLWGEELLKYFLISIVQALLSIILVVVGVVWAVSTVIFIVMGAAIGYRFRKSTNRQPCPEKAARYGKKMTPDADTTAPLADHAPKPCVQCGTPVRAESKFCPECGAPTENALGGSRV